MVFPIGAVSKMKMDKRPIKIINSVSELHRLLTLPTSWVLSTHSHSINFLKTKQPLHPSNTGNRSIEKRP